MVVATNAALLPGRKTDQISHIVISLTRLALFVDRQHLRSNLTMIVMIAVAVVEAAAGQQDSRRSFAICNEKEVVRLGARVGVLWLLYARL